MHLGIKIKVARMAKNMSQQELADKIGKSRGLIGHIEQTGEVNQKTYNKICKALGISAEAIEHLVNEPSAHYLPKDKLIEDLTTETERLRKENAMLQELIQSQKEIIALLKKKK